MQTPKIGNGDGKDPRLDKLGSLFYLALRGELSKEDHEKVKLADRFLYVKNKSEFEIKAIKAGIEVINRIFKRSAASTQR